MKWYISKNWFSGRKFITGRICPLFLGTKNRYDTNSCGWKTGHFNCHMANISAISCEIKTRRWVPTTVVTRGAACTGRERNSKRYPFTASKIKHPELSDARLSNENEVHPLWTFPYLCPLTTIELLEIRIFPKSLILGWEHYIASSEQQNYSENVQASPFRPCTTWTGE